MGKGKHSISHSVKYGSGGGRFGLLGSQPSTTIGIVQRARDHKAAQDIHRLGQQSREALEELAGTQSTGQDDESLMDDYMATGPNSHDDNDINTSRGQDSAEANTFVVQVRDAIRFRRIAGFCRAITRTEGPGAIVLKLASRNGSLSFPPLPKLLLPGSITLRRQPLIPLSPTMISPIPMDTTSGLTFSTYTHYRGRHSSNAMSSQRLPLLWFIPDTSEILPNNPPLLFPSKLLNFTIHSGFSNHLSVLRLLPKSSVTSTKYILHSMSLYFILK
ncbi:hypothetical protein VKT23_016588 [Stygiomarasmius scandens]|uniref:Uncharacterized protein n=1 Tax=Marasmiellus scandens TaxID=2682957 RepID=A0ABR1IYR6_9AGAR